ncbi:MAG: preprotein translocase subunit SecG [Woeseia sp.]
MQSVVLIGHTLIAVLIIVLVLLQRGKGADAGAAFGAGASGTVFGARGSSSFFSRATAVLATAFFASSLFLAYLSSQRSTAPESLLEDAAPIEAEQRPESIETGESADVAELPELPDLSGSEPAADDTDLPPLEVDEPADGPDRQ